VHAKVSTGVGLCVSVVLAWALGSPAPAVACACGCGVFDVGVGSMFPTQSGPTVFLEEDYTDQDRNWSGTAAAPAQDNADERIRTFFTTIGAQYLFDRSWGAIIEIPYWQRQLTTTLGDGSLGTSSHATLGDIRLRGVYSGFSADLSTGISLGVKLPTGDSTYPNFDPDTEIGSGSTDLLLGAYHLGPLTADNRWSWFADAQWQQPLLHKAAYRPGAEVDAAVGAYRGGLTLSTVRLTPIVQLEFAYRRHDGGPEGDPLDTGYLRGYLAPGMQVDFGRVRLYAEMALPLYTNASGNQLMASALFKLNAAFHF
jgi:hypothetical protein